MEADAVAAGAASAEGAAAAAVTAASAPAANAALASVRAAETEVSAAVAAGARPLLTSRTRTTSPPWVPSKTSLVPRRREKEKKRISSVVVHALSLRDKSRHSHCLLTSLTPALLGLGAE